MKVETAIKENNGNKLACKERLVVSCHPQLDNLSCEEHEQWQRKQTAQSSSRKDHHTFSQTCLTGTREIKTTSNNLIGFFMLL